MSKFGNCVFCGVEQYNTSLKNYSCRECRDSYDLNTTWAKKLIEFEKYWRKLEMREDRKNVNTFSDTLINKNGESYNAWDVMNGEIAFTEPIEPIANSFSEDARYVPQPDKMIIAYSWCTLAKLTEGETNAIFVRIGHETENSTKLAELLGKIENKKVSAVAYRRRLSDARKKLRNFLS